MPRLVKVPRLQALQVDNIFDLDYNLLPNMHHLSDCGYGVNWYDHEPDCLDTLRELPFLESFLAPNYFSSADIALFLKKAPNLKKLFVYLPYDGRTTKTSKQKVRYMPL
jgi:hypothetical protein